MYRMFVGYTTYTRSKKSFIKSKVLIVKYVYETKDREKIFVEG